MALFLASDEASYVNGQAFPVDGGLTSHSVSRPLSDPGKPSRRRPAAPTAVVRYRALHAYVADRQGAAESGRESSKRKPELNLKP